MSLFPIPPHTAFIDVDRYRKSVDEQRRKEHRSSNADDEAHDSPARLSVANTDSTACPGRGRCDGCGELECICK